MDGRWILLGLLVMGAMSAPAAVAQDPLTPTITIEGTITPSGSLLRPPEGRPYDAISVLEDPIRLDLRITCEADPVLLVPYEGTLRLDVSDNIWLSASFSQTDPMVPEMEVAVPFDRDTCDASAPWTASYELYYHMNPFALDALETLDFKVHALYMSADGTTSLAETSVPWSETIGGWIEEIDLFFPQEHIQAVERDRWLLEDVKFVTDANGPLTVEGLVLQGPRTGTLSFEPPRLDHQDGPFTDPIRTYWAGADPENGLDGLRLGYRFTVVGDPESASVFEHPGLGPVRSSGPSLTDVSGTGFPWTGVVVLWGLLSVGAVVWFQRRGRAD